MLTSSQNSAAVDKSFSHVTDVKQMTQITQGPPSHKHAIPHDDSVGMPVYQATAVSHEYVEARTRALDEQLLLTKPSLRLSDDVTESMMGERRRRFWQFVSERVEKTSEIRPVINHTFDHGEVNELANFFFEEMMGAGSLAHIASLIHDYKNRKKGELENAVAMGRRNCTPEGNTSLLLRQFFSTIPNKKYMAHSNNTPLEMLYLNVLKIDV